jgi:hypothetical protein
MQISAGSRDDLVVLASGEGRGGVLYSICSL